MYRCVYHARLAQPILHRQHFRQAQSRSGLKLPEGDLHGRGGHLGQRLGNKGGTWVQICQIQEFLVLQHNRCEEEEEEEEGLNLMLDGVGGASNESH